jgi:hypothetical protein
MGYKRKILEIEFEKNGDKEERGGLYIKCEM